MLVWGPHIQGTTVERVYARLADDRVDFLTVEFSNGALLDVMISKSDPNNPDPAARTQTVAPFFWSTADLVPAVPPPRLGTLPAATPDAPTPTGFTVPPELLAVAERLAAQEGPGDEPGQAEARALADMPFEDLMALVQSGNLGTVEE